MIDPLRVRLGFGGMAINKTFDSFEASAQPEAYEKAMGFLDSRRSLVLEGPNGTGKTHLALAIGNALLDRYGVARIPAYFLIFDEALMRLRATYQDGYEGMGEEWFMERWRSVPVLILDEVGQTGRDKPPGDGDFTRRTGYAIVDGRYRRGNRPIILTTNKSVEELGEWITVAAVDRLFEMADWVTLGGESWRVHPRTSSTTRTG
jgi:DNA replication protein DnaC